MKIVTHHFGEVKFTEDKIIRFENGLYGFEDLKKYLFIKSDDSFFFWLNSIERPEIAFPLFGIRVLDDNFPQEENYEAFGITTMSPDPLNITVNLKAPVYINQNDKLGYQKIIDTDKYPVHYKLFSE
ncbi:MAG: flagellar biosynthesis protein FliW [Ignavibacteriae bacterium HGW-Ignavibacteriae-3]|nr:MAG: flagellar biosynthesis protein FliW [Ignavibacteriae bacterium HGW-Ignavibacteriae-3]